MSTATLVVELLTEELPPKALKQLGAAFAESLVAGLLGRDFVAADAKVTAFATPRRLAVAIANVLAVAPDAEVTAQADAGEGRSRHGRPAFGSAEEEARHVGPGTPSNATLDASDGPDHIFVNPTVRPITSTCEALRRASRSRAGSKRR